MKHLVAGLGEVGKAILALLQEKYDVVGVDKEGTDGKFAYLHICYPYSKDFIRYVNKDITKYKPKLIIIHSTVPIGTTEKIKNAVHSPIRGVHPELLKGIKTFVKFFGGEKAKDASKIFKGLCNVSITKNSRDTELGKLLDTAYYGWNIVFNKQAKKLCDKYGTNFNTVYTDFNWTYNEGYELLDRYDVVRPVLKYISGKIGGHCVIPNCKLLNDEISKFILKYDNRRKI